MQAFLNVLFLMLLLSNSAHAEQALNLDDGFTASVVGKNIDQYLDVSARLTIHDILVQKDSLPWELSTVDVPNFGFQKSAFWGRLHIVDKRQLWSPLILEFGYPQIDYLDIYLVSEGKLVETFQSGDHRLRNDWPIDNRLPTFILPQQKDLWIYVRAAGESSLQVPLRVAAERTYHEHRLIEESFQAMYFGALIAMLAYNLLVAIGTKLRVYLYYVAFLFGYGMFQVSLTGHGYLLIWSSFPSFVDYSVIVSSLLFSLSSIVFTVQLLEVEKARRLTRWFLIYYSVGCVLAALGYFVLPYSATIRFMIAFLVLPWMMFLLSYGTYALKNGGEVARWFMLAWFVFIVGSVVTALRLAGVIATNKITINAMQIGSVIEFIVLSFALAQRIKTLQKRIHEEQEHALGAEKKAREADAKALAEERRLSEQRDQLVANTSHELRTPLNGMMGLVQAIIKREGDQLSPDTKRSLAGVVASSKRLAALIGDLLDFSRGQRGQMPLFRGALSVKEQAQQVLDLIAVTLEGRDVVLRLDIPSDLPAVYADPDRLQQVLFNLLGNACKFTEHGHIEVAAKHDGNRVLISVEDTGLGISPEAQTRIFEAFTQADGGIARRYGGTGLGLAIVKQLVEAHGGELGLQSLPGFGSTFWFSLPVSDDQSQNVPQTPLSTTLEQRLITLKTQMEAATGHESIEAKSPEFSYHASPGTPLEILVVDDEPMNRQVLQELLSLNGHHVTLAPDGPAALSRIAENQVPDVMLLDVMMPGITGFEVLSTLRKRFNEAELPIILLTAKALEKDLVQGFSLGASDYILKPFVAEEVEARMTHQARLKEAMWQSKAAREEGARLRQQLLNTEDQLLHAERLASIGASTAGIAHDLSNPIHHIHTTLEWIRQRIHNVEALPSLPDPAKPEIQEIYETIALADKAACTAEDLTHAIRVAVRTDDGAAGLFRVKEVIDDVLKLLHHKLKFLEVSCQCDEALAIRGKRSELIQLVMNLVSNAADAIGESSVKKLSVQLIKEHNQVKLSVEDSGPGVPEKLRPLIFDPFYTTKPSGKGTGLGLAVVRTVTKHHGGVLQVDDSPSLGGARFTVIMPAA